MRQIIALAAAGLVALVSSGLRGQDNSTWDATAADPVAFQTAVTAAKLFNGVDRPLIINVAGEHLIGKFELILLDEVGQTLAGPVQVRGGRLDLAEVMPEIWRIRRSCYLQLLDYERPAGPALVLRPMLSRMVPVTEQDQRSSGAAYTRIVGWRDELAPPPVEEEPASEEEAEGDEGENPASGNEGAETTGGFPPPIEDTTWADAAAGREVATTEETAEEVDYTVFSGLWAYTETEVVMRTTLGDIVLAMAPEEAPQSAWNFLRLCQGGFYDDITFHRILKYSRSGLPFVIQAGDPTGMGDGGPGYWLPIEPSRVPHDYGVISMARADDPDSAGSQFFICLSREGTARLDGQYCAFGYAIEGGITIDAIADVEMADAELGQPVDPPVILGTELRPAPPHYPGENRWARKVDEAAVRMENRKPERVPR